MRPRRVAALALWPALLLAGCVTNGPEPRTAQERAAYAAFQRDRDACRAVAENSAPYVPAGDSRGAADRSTRVEADAQRCMLSRGWNDPRYDGWAQGRSWGG